ncbi:hypothetical protein [Prosthecobacter sp.]|uniref:hypothetical protein n=1 Tax=Prosthecobacter sp. TaxID=1965333 RepID=UPI0037836729
MKCTKLYPAVFVLTALFLFAFKLTVSQPAQVDEIFFKSPGLSWASGTGWRSPEEPHYGGWQPPLNEVFASYPPVYPFLFGCCVKIFGFSWRVCAGYDAVIHILLSGVLILFLRSAAPSKQGMAWNAGWLFLLSGYPPRPDQLAMSFGYGALALILGLDEKCGWRRLVLSGVLFGFCLGTSVPCSVALAPLLVALMLRRHRVFGLTFKRFVVICGVATATALVIVLPVWLYHHGALAQNLNATASITGYTFSTSLGHLFRYWYPVLIAVGIFMLPGVMALFVNLKLRQKEQVVSWLVWYGSISLPLAFFFLKSTFQGSYYWFFIPWLIAALSQFHLYGPQVPRCTLAILLVGFLPLTGLNVRMMLGAYLTPSDQRIEAFRQTVEGLVPEGASVACGGDYWWLFAHRNQVYDLLNHAALQADQVDYVVVTGIGSGGADKHGSLPPFAGGERFQLIHSQPGPSLPSLLGIPLFRSTFSPAPAVFRRKDAHGR